MDTVLTNRDGLEWKRMLELGYDWNGESWSRPEIGKLLWRQLMTCSPCQKMAPITLGIDRLFTRLSTR